MPSCLSLLCTPCFLIPGGSAPALLLRPPSDFRISESELTLLSVVVEEARICSIVCSDLTPRIPHIALATLQNDLTGVQPVSSFKCVYCVQ